METTGRAKSGEGGEAAKDHTHLALYLCRHSWGWAAEEGHAPSTSLPAPLLLLPHCFPPARCKH